MLHFVFKIAEIHLLHEQFDLSFRASGSNVVLSDINGKVEKFRAKLENSTFRITTVHKHIQTSDCIFDDFSVVQYVDLVIDRSEV